MKNSLTLPEDEVKRRLEAKEPFVIRLKVPRKDEIRNGGKCPCKDYRGRPVVVSTILHNLFFTRFPKKLSHNSAGVLLDNDLAESITKKKQKITHSKPMMDTKKI